MGVRNEESQARERALLSAGVCSCTGTLASGTNGFFYFFASNSRRPQHSGQEASHFPVPVRDRGFQISTESAVRRWVADSL